MVEKSLRADAIMDRITYGYYKIYLNVRTQPKISPLEMSLEWMTRRQSNYLAGGSCHTGLAAPPQRNIH